MAHPGSIIENLLEKIGEIKTDRYICKASRKKFW